MAGLSPSDLPAGTPIPEEPAASEVRTPEPRGTQRLAEAVRLLDNGRVPVAELTLRRPTLDEIFLSLTVERAGMNSTSADHRDTLDSRSRVGGAT